jgi:uncharacterized phage-associated protein
MLYFRFDEEKALSVILYIAKELWDPNRKGKPDFHKIFKILYFADQKHLVRYGRPVVGDYYVAMEHGPVPSNIYDILKSVRGDSIFDDVKGFGSYFDVKSHYVYPKKAPDMDAFSESDVECLKESMEENQYLTFKELKKKSHDEAYDKATKDDKISYRAMARAAGADSAMIAYMRTLSENERIFNACPLPLATTFPYNAANPSVSVMLSPVRSSGFRSLIPPLQKSKDSLS